MAAANNIPLSDLNKMAWDLRYSNLEEALHLAQQAKELATELQDDLNANYAKLTIAQLLFWKTADDEQLRQASEALVFFENSNEQHGLTRAHIICAGIYDQYGQYEKALSHAQAAVKLSKHQEDWETKADSYTVQGQLFSRTGDYTQAIKRLRQGLEIRQQLNDEKAIASSLNLIGRNLLLNKNFDEAESYYKQSLELRQKINDVTGIPWTYIGLASLYNDIQKFDEALKYYKLAEDAQNRKEKRFELLCLIGKGKIYIAQSEPLKAIDCLIKALDSAKQLKIISLIAETHQLLSAAYEKNKDLKNALEHYKQYNTLQQELMSSEKVNQLKHQQIAFSVESLQKEAEIHRLKNIELKQAFDRIAAQHHELEIKNKEIRDSIDYAKYIQDAYLPSREYIKKVMPFTFLFFQPKDIISGDFYWFYNNHTDTESSNKNSAQHGSQLLFAVADSTGHGVPGAIMSFICYNALNNAVRKDGLLRPDLILNRSREIIMDSFKQQQKYDTRKDGMDIALVGLSHFPKKDEPATLQYAGAYNPLWIIREGKPKSENNITDHTNTHYLIEIKADRQPVGAYERMHPFTLHEIEVHKGDTIYLFSDGYADQFGGDKGEKLKSKTLKDLLLSSQHKSMAEQHTLLKEKLNSWKNGHEQVDDICVVGVKI